MRHFINMVTLLNKCILCNKMFPVKWQESKQGNGHSSQWRQLIIHVFD